MNDRRRTNAPPGGTKPPVFTPLVSGPEQLESLRYTRSRDAKELRKMFLKTGLIPSASGSAYLELQTTSPSPSSTTSTTTTTTSSSSAKPSLIPPPSSLKITCAVHGPKPLPRSAPFSPHLVLSTYLKFAPFASRHRRGYIRDSRERDLGVHLEAALRGVIIGDRWPKSGVDVVITVLEGEEDRWWGDEAGGGSDGLGGAGSGTWGSMTVLAGAITAASAAIADAGIDCVDMISGGVAAVVRNPSSSSSSKAGGETALVLDPCPSEHQEILGACVVGYLGNRDEITELWLKGDSAEGTDELVSGAVDAAIASRAVLVDAITEAAAAKFPDAASKTNVSSKS